MNGDLIALFPSAVSRNRKVIGTRSAITKTMSRPKPQHTCSQHGLQDEMGQTKLGAITHVLLDCGCTLEQIDDDYVTEGDAVLHGEELYRVDGVADGIVTITNKYRSKNVPIELVTYIAEDTLSAPKPAKRICVGAEVRHKKTDMVGTVSRQDAHGRWMVLVWDATEKKQRTFVWAPEALEVLKEASNVADKLYIPRSEYTPTARSSQSSDYVYRSSRSSKSSWDDFDHPPPRKKKKKSHSISTADLIKEEVSDLRKKDTADPAPITKSVEKKQETKEEPDEKVVPKKRKGVW